MVFILCAFSKQSCLVYLNSNCNDFFETLPRIYLLCFFGCRFIKTGIVGYNKNNSIITQLSSGHDVMEVLMFFVIWIMVILFDITNGSYCLLLQHKDRVRVHLCHCSPYQSGMQRGSSKLLFLLFILLCSSLFLIHTKLFKEFWFFLVRWFSTTDPTNLMLLEKPHTSYFFIASTFLNIERTSTHVPVWVRFGLSQGFFIGWEVWT